MERSCIIYCKVNHLDEMTAAFQSRISKEKNQHYFIQFLQFSFLVFGMLLFVSLTQKLLYPMKVAKANFDFSGSL